MPSAPLVLIIEDDEDSRQMYDVYLSASNLRVEQATDGDDGFSKAHYLRPAVIVTDLGISNGGGIELISRLKQNDRTRAIPIVVLTGTAREEDRRRATAAGCDSFLMKPCAPEQLVNELERLIGYQGAPAPEST
ncbi:MAG: response regulator [Acidobacteria bacterium]|nr:response regulator [Acidobacteriota bacterium]